VTFSRNVLLTLAGALNVMLLHTYSNNDRSGVNCGVLADTDAGKDEAVRSDPHIPTNVHFRSRRGAIWTAALDTSGIRWCLYRINGHVGTDGRVIADRDVT
jgi:hypothetical protein